MRITPLITKQILKLIETSWANARVKLHSRVHFKSKKIKGPKKFWVKKVMDPKTLSQKNILITEKFASKKF